MNLQHIIMVCFDTLAIGFVYATYKLVDTKQKKIEADVHALRTQRDLATMVALNIIREDMIRQEKYEAAAILTRQINEFTKDEGFDIIISERIPKKY